MKKSATNQRNGSRLSFDCIKTNQSALKTSSTRVSLLLELVSDAYLTANRIDILCSSRQETTPLDHTSQKTIRIKAAIKIFYFKIE